MTSDSAPACVRRVGGPLSIRLAALVVSVVAVLVWSGFATLGRCGGLSLQTRGDRSWMCRVHRGLAVVFTVGVVADLVTLSVLPDEPLVWVGLFTLGSLVLLTASGLILVVWPRVSS